MSSQMTAEFEPQARPATAMLRLHGRATYREAPELRRQLFTAIEASGDKNLVVELRGIERIDTAAMAVLVEALVATRDRGPDIFLFHASEAVYGVFRMAGLEEALTRCYNCWEDVEQAMVQ